MAHLKTYPFVQKRLEEGALQIHGWWFDIKEAEVYEYEPSVGQFQVIDEKYAEVLLARAETYTPTKK